MKRFFDFFLSLVLIIIFSPLLLIIGLFIKKEDGDSIFYKGERIGKGGRRFKMYKFRTMVENAEKMGGTSTSDGDARLTNVGRCLRKYKLDELPQLINVLIGDMSLVGPRPEVKKYVDMYSEKEMDILSVRPGITDWASLANPDEGATLAQYDDPDKAYEEIIRPEKLMLQLRYVRERSFFKDVQILFLTLKIVLAK